MFNDQTGITTFTDNKPTHNSTVESETLFTHRAQWAHGQINLVNWCQMLTHWRTLNTETECSMKYKKLSIQCAADRMCCLKVQKIKCTVRSHCGTGMTLACLNGMLYQEIVEHLDLRQYERYEIL